MQACGDAHLSNFGVFASAERTLVFDLNDFDETLPGPWEWDVKRLAASLAIAGRDHGFSDKERSGHRAGHGRGLPHRDGQTARTSATSMSGTPASTSRACSVTSAASSGLTEAKGTGTQSQVKSRADKQLAKARTRDSLQALEKLTEVVDGETRFVSDPPSSCPSRS